MQLKVWGLIWYCFYKVSFILNNLCKVNLKLLTFIHHYSGTFPLNGAYWYFVIEQSSAPFFTVAFLILDSFCHYLFRPLTGFCVMSSKQLLSMIFSGILWHHWLLLQWNQRKKRMRKVRQTKKMQNRWVLYSFNCPYF